MWEQLLPLPCDAKSPPRALTGSKHLQPTPGSILGLFVPQKLWEGENIPHVPGASPFPLETLELGPRKSKSPVLQAGITFQQSRARFHQGFCV